MSRKIYIFDTTLRDGEQSPGAKLNTAQKVILARQLERLGVDVIEAGFPISSPGDFASVEEISKMIKSATVCALTRALPGDIECAAKALTHAKHPRIHTGIGASDVHIQYKFKSTRGKILEQGIAAVKLAKKYVEDVEFYAEDAGRSDEQFLARMVTEVIKAGATVVNIPDTTGYCMPDEFAKKIRYLFEHVSNIDKAIISAHCHNDLGMATANTLAAILAGASQAEVTVNGIGERAGNTALEEVVMAIHTRKSEFNVHTDIKTTEIAAISRMVSSIMGIPIQPNKAIVGTNAFAHSSGIHQDGVLKRRETYEIIAPVTVGYRESKIILTARSGRAALKHKLTELGFDVSDKQLNSLYKEFIKLADQKKEIYDDDLRILIGEKAHNGNRAVELILIHTISGNQNIPTASVKVKIHGVEKIESATGNGAIDACYKAISQAVDKKYHLAEFNIQAATAGTDAMARVNVGLMNNNEVNWGSGYDTDTVVAAAKAFVDALNKIIKPRKKNQTNPL